MKNCKDCNEFMCGFSGTDNVNEYCRNNIDENEVLKCGKYITDDKNVGYWNGAYYNIRIRIISYEGNIYYHKMISGECVEYILIGRSL